MADVQVASIWDSAAANDEVQKHIMLSLIGPMNDDFAIFASHSNDDTYSVVIYPAIPESSQEIDISAAEFRAFLGKQRGKIEADTLSETADIFIHSLTVDDVRELTAEQNARGNSHACRLGSA